MPILTRAGDLVYTIRFLKLLTTSFNKTKAFKMGLIDAKGKKVETIPLSSKFIIESSTVSGDLDNALFASKAYLKLAAKQDSMQGLDKEYDP